MSGEHVVTGQEYEDLLQLAAAVILDLDGCDDPNCQCDAAKVLNAARAHGSNP